MAAEIDFDELDRAVNSVLGTNTPVESTTTVAAPAVVPAPAPLPTPATPSQPVNTDAVSVSVNVNKPTPGEPTTEQDKPQVVPRPNSGRFMDMVHSSSEMKSPVRGTPVPPVGVAASQPALPDTPSDDQASNDVTSDVATGTAQDSPFLADANKVQKRPLGAFSVNTAPKNGISEHGPMTLSPVSADVQPEALPEKPAATEAAVTPDPDEPDQPAADMTTEATPLPEELQSDVLSLEADGSNFGEKPAAPIVAEPVTPAQPEEKPAEPAKPASPHEEILAKLPGSIAQQYREKAVTETPASGAIFDTQDYHKPLAAKAAKHKTPTWVLYVLWGLVLVIVGGAAGYAIYFYVLPMIQG